jgi:hypothetical protein
LLCACRRYTCFRGAEVSCRLFIFNTRAVTVTVARRHSGRLLGNIGVEHTHASSSFRGAEAQLSFRAEYSVKCQTEPKTKICFGLPKPRPIPTRSRNFALTCGVVWTMPKCAAPIDDPAGGIDAACNNGAVLSCVCAALSFAEDSADIAFFVQVALATVAPAKASSNLSSSQLLSK